MSQFLEFEGSNINNALEKACGQLNVQKEELHYTVISYGSTGIFGLVGVKKAKICVEVNNVEKDEKAENLETPAQSPTINLFSSDADVDDITLLQENIEKAKDSPEVRDPVEVGLDILQKIVNLITQDASVLSEKDNDRILFRIKGGKTAILIGKKGQTLQAMQYLVEKIINKQCTGRTRVQVDVENYMEDRKEKLQGLALRLAEKVKLSGKPVTIGQMTGHDRRIVHLTLRDDNEIRTQSMGEGFIRKLVIFPKKNSKR